LPEQTDPDDAEETADQGSAERRSLMRLAKDPLAIGIAISASILIAFFAYLAWPEPTWVGKRVLQKQRQFGLRLGSDTVDMRDRFDVYIVKQSHGPLVQVHGARSRKLGWAPLTEVVAIEKAMSSFDAQIRDNPQDAFPYAMRAFVRYDLNRSRDIDSALSDCNEAIRLDPLYAAAYEIRGELWSFRAQHDRAIEDFSAALRLDPKNAWVLTDRGQEWNHKHEDDRAIADFKEAIRLDPDSHFAPAFLAHVLFKRGLDCVEKSEDNNAIANFTEAIRLSPQFTEAYVRRGGVWSLKGEYDKAIADCNEAIRISPDHASAYAERGEAWDNKLEYDKAIADYNEAIRLEPNNRFAYIGRGQVWDHKQQHDKAVADYNEAIRLDPKSADLIGEHGGGTNLKTRVVAPATKSRPAASGSHNELDSAQVDQMLAIAKASATTQIRNFAFAMDEGNVADIRIRNLKVDQADVPHRDEWIWKASADVTVLRINPSVRDETPIGVKPEEYIESLERLTEGLRGMVAPDGKPTAMELIHWEAMFKQSPLARRDPEMHWTRIRMTGSGFVGHFGPTGKLEATWYEDWDKKTNEWRRRAGSEKAAKE
jgi:tetratricopeptide (TPR) repeat protein